MISHHVHEQSQRTQSITGLKTHPEHKHACVAWRTHACCQAVHL